jgi:hypothetical protein
VLQRSDTAESNLDRIRRLRYDRSALAGLETIMAKLTAAGRKQISAGNFALPGRRYPIEDASHARNALARVSQHGSSAEKTKVRSAVHRKYPGIGKQGGARAHADEAQDRELIMSILKKHVGGNFRGKQAGARPDLMQMQVPNLISQGPTPAGILSAMSQFRKTAPAAPAAAPPVGASSVQMPEEQGPPMPDATQAGARHDPGWFKMPSHQRTEIKVTLHNERPPHHQAGARSGDLDESDRPSASRASGATNIPYGGLPDDERHYQEWKDRQPGQGGARAGGDWSEREPYSTPSHGSSGLPARIQRGQGPGVESPQREPQAGARAALGHPRSHALAMASATHLRNMGHISDAQHQTIQNKAMTALKAGKPKQAPQMQMPVPSFGSLAPPPPPMGGPPPSQFPQAGARHAPSAPKAKPYPKYGAGHYMSTPTPTGDDEDSAGARRKGRRW